jgi:hypothetical protein
MNYVWNSIGHHSYQKSTSGSFCSGLFKHSNDEREDDFSQNNHIVMWFLLLSRHKSLHSGQQITYDSNVHSLNFHLSQTETPKLVLKDTLIYYCSSSEPSSSLKM